MAGKQVTELDALPSFTDNSLLPVHNGAGLKKGLLSQLANYLGTKFSNPNLLINPDFRINQRGKTEYAYQTSGIIQYTVDRFRVVYLNVKTASDGLILNANGGNAEGGHFSQVLEYSVKGNTILSFKVSAVVGNIEFGNLDSEDNGNILSVSSDGTYTVKGSNTRKVIVHITKGSSCKIEWIKLEQGKVATEFIAPNYSEELLKCERFFIKNSEIIFIPYSGTRESLGNSGQYFQNISGLFPVKMRAIPTVTYRIVRKADNSTIFDKISSFGVDNYGISTITMDKILTYFTLRVIDVEIDAEIY